MTYVLLAVFFWLGMLVERHFVKEVEPEPPARPEVGDVYWSKYERLRFRVVEVHQDITLTADPPPKHGAFAITAAGELGDDWSLTDA